MFDLRKQGVEDQKTMKIWIFISQRMLLKICESRRNYRERIETRETENVRSRLVAIGRKPRSGKGLKERRGEVVCSCANVRHESFVSRARSQALSRKGLAWPRRVRRAARSNRDRFPSLGSRLLVLVPLPLIFLELVPPVSPLFEPLHVLRQTRALPASLPISPRIYARRYVSAFPGSIWKRDIRDLKWLALHTWQFA